MTPDRRQLLIGGLAATTGSWPQRVRAQDPAALGISLVSYPSGSFPINGLLFSPVGEARGGPMAGAGVALLHGGGGAQDDVHIFTEGALGLTAQGYHCLMPNYFDATPSQRRSTGVAARRWRKAILDGLGWLGGRPGVDPDRVGALGFSRGGSLGLDGVLEEGGAQAFVGVASGGSLDVADIRHRPPVLFIYADGDPLVSARRVEARAATLAAAAVPVETHELSSPRHRFDPDEWRSVFDVAGRFLDRTLA
jgi:dienelactone hydrolase